MEAEQRLPEGWSRDQLAQLHPALVAVLVPCVLAAQALGLRVRFASGWRSNAHQQHLRDTYEERLALWQGSDQRKAKPLPACKPGESAHNLTLCTVDASHDCVGHDDKCPACDGALIPASPACDVQILDPATGNAIPSGGQVALAHRHLVWQRWAAVVKEHPFLRDGGEFHNIDPVHVEHIGWDYGSHHFHADAQPVVVAEESDAPASEPSSTKRTSKRRG